MSNIDTLRLFIENAPAAFGLNWLDWETYEPGLMDDQGRFISIYRLFENTPASLFLYLAEME